MLKSTRILVLCLTSCVVSVYAKLPPEVERCKAGDAKCIMKSLNYILENIYKGDPDIGLESIDPMETNNFNILNNKENSPVSLELKFSKSKSYGFRKYRAVKMSGFGKAPEGRHEIFFKAPRFSLVGDYTMNGKVLILPVVGEGIANITFTKPELRLRIDAISKEKNGETYLHINNMYLDTKVESMSLNFTGLFKGDQVLGETVSKFMNENWKDIYNEIKRPVLDAYTVILKSFLEKVFSHTPYNKILDTSSDK